MKGWLAMVKISIDGLENEIATALQEYTSEVEEGLEKSKLKVARRAVSTLKDTSPKDSGEYAKGWGSLKRGTNRIIRNRTKPGLTHLLEKGYAKVSGGRTAAIPHIKPVEEQVIKDYESEVKKVIRNP